MIASVTAAAAGGLLLSLSFPPARLDLLAWIAFVPLLWATEKAPKAPVAALYGAVFGIAFFLIDLSWIRPTLVVHGHFSQPLAILLFLCMVLTLALFPATFALMASLFAGKGLPAGVTAPFIWTGLEYVRAVVLTGFPWDLAGYSQVERLTLTQISDMTGVYGVSFVVLLVNGTLWELLRAIADRERRPWKLLLTTLLTMTLVLVYGKMRVDRFSRSVPAGPAFKIGILQANIPQQIKWAESARDHTFFTYEKLAARAVEQGADFLVWPETSVPILFGLKSFGWKRPGEISRKLGVPMLVGAPSGRKVNGRPKYYNSAFLIDGPSLRDRYDKIHLVPFGEYMPLSWLLPLGPGIAAREADYTPGETMTVMSVDRGPPFSVLICYEAIFPGLSRSALKNGARMLINITNDGWFGETAAPYQHLAISRLRSVENRVWLLRCANTGVSAAFDPAGRMVASIPLNEEGFLVVRVPRSPTAGSFYTRFGDLFAWGCLVSVMIAAVIVTDFRTTGRRRGTDPRFAYRRKEGKES